MDDLIVVLYSFRKLFCLVVFTRFNFLNSYIWFEFYNAPLEKDVSLICDVSSNFS